MILVQHESPSRAFPPPCARDGEISERSEFDIHHRLQTRARETREVCVDQIRSKKKKLTFFHKRNPSDFSPKNKDINMQLAARTRTNTPSFSRDDHRYSTMMRRRTKRKALFFAARFRRRGRSENGYNLDDDGKRVLTESDADCFVHRNRRQMLFASSTAAAFSATNNIAAFAGSSEWASLNDGSAPGLASPPPSNADPIIKKTERLGLKYLLLALEAGTRK